MKKMFLSTFIITSIMMVSIAGCVKKTELPPLEHYKMGVQLLRESCGAFPPDFDTFEWQEKQTLFICNRLQQINSKRQM